MSDFLSRTLLSRTRNLCAFLLAVCCAVTAGAQGRFCLGGDLQHLSVAQRTMCSAKLAAVRAAAQRLGAPEDWHVVLVCGEEGWKAYAAFSSRTAAEVERASADTDLNRRETYLREERLSDPANDASSGRVLAHEVAAMILQTTDEAALQARMKLWLPSLPTVKAGETAVLTASR